MNTESQKAFEEWHDNLFDLSANTAVKSQYGYPENKHIQMRWQAWQASREHIIAKLQSEEMLGLVSAALAKERYDYAMWIEDTEDDNIANAHNCEEYINKHWTGFKDQAKAAIAAVLEGL